MQAYLQMRIQRPPLKKIIVVILAMLAFVAYAGAITSRAKTPSHTAENPRCNAELSDGCSVLVK
jgi:hypothetical protein